MPNPMRPAVILSVLLLCGCSQKHTTHVDQSIDIVAGKDIAVRDRVVSVQKRDGNSIQGIRIVRKLPGGKETIITANTGTIAQSPNNSVTLTLSKALVQTKTRGGATESTAERLEIRF